MFSPRWLAVSFSGAFLLAASAATPGVAPPPPCTSTVVGTLEIVPFTSKLFANTRNLRVWLPPGYEDAANAARRYPVLYLLDAQNLFDGCTAFDHVHEWRVDETLSQLIGAGAVPPLLVVGIDNAGAQRAHEFLPYKDSIYAPQMSEPAGRQFPEFLATEVLPFIAAKYRVEPGPQTIGGSSYGGIAALYAVLTRPDLFHSALIESPSLQVGNGQLLRDTEHLFRGPRKVYLGIGGSEFDGGPASVDNVAFVALFHALEANLRHAALHPPKVLAVVQNEGQHNEAAWAARLPAALKFLYGPE